MVEFVAALLGSAEDLLVKAVLLVLVADAAFLVTFAAAAVIVSATNVYNTRVHSSRRGLRRFVL